MPEGGVLVCFFFVCCFSRSRECVIELSSSPIARDSVRFQKKIYIPTTPYYYPRLQCASVNSQCHGFQPPPNF
ncbi:Uncharacterized protein APZ42_015001 [Daphnia magna]|uniref:Secreted protein n=1 Tax=Daphnia magna TaxID=35525 RepID=A0A162P2V8_9CRUS|nr:Uncharacterized protein APZ42_015001 [Daphnia magna]